MDIEFGEDDGRAGDVRVIREVFECLPNALGSLTVPGHTFVSANAAYRAILGRENIVGHGAAEVMPELMGQRVFELLDRVVATGEVQTAREWRTHYSPGPNLPPIEKFFDFTVVPWRDAGGTVVGVAFEVRDVSDRVEERREAHARSDEFEQAFVTARAAVVTMQRALLSPAVPIFAGADVGAEYLVAEAEDASGGDWFDAIPVSGTEVAVVVGDVVGHGISAAAVMGQLRAVLRQQLLAGVGAAGAVAALDAFAAEVPGARNTTVCVAVLDSSSGTLEYVTAGHPQPLLMKTDGAVAFLPVSGGGPLVTGSEFRSATTHLDNGDALLLYTDGLVEPPGRPVTAATVDLAQTAGRSYAARAFVVAPEGARPVDRICSETMELMLRSQGHRDDVTLLALQRVPPRAPFEVSVPVDLSSVREVRNRLRAWLVGMGAGRGAVTGVEHAVSELVSNAVEHAYPPQEDPTSDVVEVSGVLGHDGRVEFTVRDSGRWKPPDTGDAADNRGRGLALARLLVDDLMVDGTTSGTTAVVTQRLTRNVGIHTTVEPTVARTTTRHRFDLDETEPGRLVVRGDVDSLVVPTLAGRIDRLSNGGTSPLMVDLNDVTHLGSSAVAVLLRASSRDGGRESRPILVAKPGTVAHHILGLLGVDSISGQGDGEADLYFDIE